MDQNPQRKPGRAPIGREHMSAPEITAVLKRYELGRVISIRELRAGDPGAPKAIVESARGTLLLKRRSKACDDPYLVAFQHGLQLSLGSMGYPVAALLGTRDENNSMVQDDGRVYELFHFVDGRPADESPAQAGLAGEALAQLHRLSASYNSTWSAPEDRSSALERVRRRIARIETSRPELQRVCARLGALSDWAHHALLRLGRDRSPSRVIHGDWHPGNLLFRDGRLVGVIDFDASRRGDRLSDLAQGLVQFSLQRGDRDPSRWPEAPDLDRLEAMYRGYARAGVTDQGTAEAAPLMMVETLVKETVGGVRAERAEGPRDGEPFLSAIAKKGEWIEQHIESLRNRLCEPSDP